MTANDAVGRTSPPSTIAPHTGLARGTLLVLGAEALAFPAGLISTILLTRNLPTAQYGALALGLAAVAWLEWTVVSLFSRAAFKVVAERTDWHGVAAAIVRVFLGAGLLVGLIVFFSADFFARLFGVPALGTVLRVLAIEIPLFTAAHAYRTILVGRGMHGSRAAVTATRWIARALLITVGVLLGFGLNGLAALITAATAAELAFVRWRVDPVARLTNAHSVSLRPLVAFAAPLAISAICLRLFDRIDLFMIRLLGASLETVAAYGVAQNLALAPALLASALVPGLIAALSYRLATGDGTGAQQTATNALRFSLLIVPVACLAAGAAPVLVESFFGVAYRPSAPLFGVLVIAGVGMLIASVASSILLATGHPRWTLALSAPLLPVAAVAHLLVIPRAGALGAAVVTALTAFSAAAVSGIAVRRVAGTPLPLRTLARTLIVGAGAFWAGSAFLPGPGIAGLIGVAILALAVAAALALAGELTIAERGRAIGWAAAAFRSARRPAA